MPSANQLNEQKDPAASAPGSNANCAEKEQLASGCLLENQETTATSLIDDWIDA